MGQQQTVTVAGSALRRMVLAFLVAALMAATLVATAPAALADPGNGDSSNGFGPGYFKNDEVGGDGKNEPAGNGHGNSFAKAKGDFLN